MTPGSFSAFIFRMWGEKNEINKMMLSRNSVENKGDAEILGFIYFKGN